jgi:hypothetical protein
VGMVLLLARLFFVIRSQAGIQCLRFSFLGKKQGFHSPSASGLLSLLVQRKVTKETHPRRRGLQASCLPTSRGCSGVRWMYVHVHSANGRTSCAPSCGLFLRTLAAPQGARLGGIMPQKPAAILRRRNRLRRGSTGMYGFVDSGAVRVAEHRSHCRTSPQAPRPAPSLLPTFGQCQKWVARPQGE